MKPPKIDICIEGYDTNQTDFYIENLIERHESDSKMISELQTENRRLRSELELISDSVKGFTGALEKIGTRLSAVEKALGISEEKAKENICESISENCDRAVLEEQRAEIQQRMQAVKSSIDSLRTIMKK